MHQVKGYVSLTLKIGFEEFWFVSLNFTMLNGFIVQKGVQFNSFVSGRTILVLWRIFSDPEMNIVFELVTFGIFVSVKNDVRISVVKFTILIIFPVSNLFIDLINECDIIIAEVVLSDSIYDIFWSRHPYIRCPVNSPVKKTSLEQWKFSSGQKLQTFGNPG